MSPRAPTAAALLVSLVCLVSLTGCSSGTGPTTSAPLEAPPRTPLPSTAPPATSDTGRTPPDHAIQILGVQDVTTDLATPWGLARLSDGSHLVSLRDEARVIRIATDGRRSEVTASGPGGTVPGVRPDGEGGLLGLAVQPVGSGGPQQVYAYITGERDNRVVRMTLSNGRLGAPHAVITKIPKATVHNGGRIAFGPDGMLYVTTGDGGERSLAQDRRSLAGKILRVTPTGAPAPGNPFPGSPVWTLGHRNVQGIGWDAQGRMFASEFGQNTWDELNRIEPGHDYGWPTVEGMGAAQDRKDRFTAPLVVWRTDEASPSGLAVGDGAVWLAALRGERLWRVPLHDDGSVGTPQSVLHDRLGRLRTIEVSADGSLLLLTSNTFRGSPRPHDDRLVRVTVGPAPGP